MKDVITFVAGRAQLGRRFTLLTNSTLSEMALFLAADVDGQNR